MSGAVTQAVPETGTVPPTDPETEAVAGKTLPTLSVVVTCKNSAGTLAATLESIAAQTYGGWWEVLVVDNASTDATAAIGRSFADRLPHLRVLPVPDPGYQAAGLNHGIAESTGDAIVFLDSDDIVDPGYLEHMGAALATHAYVGGRMDIDVLNPAEIRSRREPLQQDRIDVIGWREAVVGASMGARREAVLKVGGFDESLPTQHDLDISWRLLDAGIPATFVPGAVLHYRYRTGPAEIFSQERGYGVGEVVLYRKFRASGMRRRRPRQVALTLFRLLVAAAQVRRPGGRAKLATLAGITLGRLEGSLRTRTLFL